MARGGKREGAGRKPGIPNELSGTVKAMISNAAIDMGGKDRLVSWAKEEKQNERIFWKDIWPKLLPFQVSGDGGGSIKISVLRFSDECQKS